MEPKRQDLSTQLPDLTLYREDFDKLLRLMKEYCETISISDQEASYDSLDDMKQHTGDRVTEIEIAGRNPQIHISLGGAVRNHNSINAFEYGDRSEALFLKVKDFLIGCKNRRSLIYKGFIGSFWALFIIFGSTVVKPIEGKASLTTSPLFKSPIVLGVSGLLLFWVTFSLGAFAVKMNPNNFLTLESRRATNFWKRNRDKIILLLIGAGAAEALHFIADYFSKSK